MASYVSVAQTLAQAITSLQKTQRVSRIYFFAGPEENGVLTMGTASALAALSPRVSDGITLVHVTPRGAHSEDNRRMRERVPASIDVITVETNFEPIAFDPTDVVIDGLFGIECETPLVGGFEAMINYINSVDPLTISLTLPSGMYADGSNLGKNQVMVEPQATILTLPLIVKYLSDAIRAMGRVFEVAYAPDEVGSIWHQEKVEYRMINEARIKARVQTMSEWAHKGTFGNALLVAGSTGMAGAAVMAAKGAMRSGVGKLTCFSCLCNREILQNQVPQAMVLLDENPHFWRDNIDDLEHFSHVCIGPGLGQNPDTGVALDHTLRALKLMNIPCVLDADALNLMANHKEMMRHIPDGSILTPHLKELERLSCRCASVMDLIVQAERIAKDYNCYVVVKGHNSAICYPDGSLFINPTGNAGMATGGSGDVLSGVLLGLLAHGYAPEDAVRLGVYIHGLAGDLAAEALTPIAMHAGDIIEYLPQAWKHLMEK